MRTPEPKRHRLALLGLGTMGLRHARVFAGLPDRFEVVGAYDPRTGSDLPADLPLLASEGEAVARAEVVVVATPVAAHAGATARALAAGRSVLVEKPVCPSAAEAAILKGVAARSAGRVYVGHSERFNPVVRTLVRLLRRDPPLAMEFRRVGPFRGNEVGVLVNHGVHDLDLAAYLGGGDVDVRGSVGSADFADVVFETSTGAVGHIHVDRTAPAKHRAIRVTTRHWTYEGDLLAHRLLRSPKAATGVASAGAEVPMPIEEPLVAQARALADALDGTGSHEIATLRDGAAAVALAELAAAACAQTAAPQELLGAPR